MAIPIGQLALGCNLDWLIQTHGSVGNTVNFPKWVKRFTNTGLRDTGIGNMHIDPVVSQHLPRGGGYALMQDSPTLLAAHAGPQVQGRIHQQFIQE